MKPVLVVCAMAALATQGVFAQSSLTIYGVLDGGIEHVSNVGASRSGLTRFPGSTGLVPSRIGFRGSEDHGAGLRTVFTLETGLASDNGSLAQGGRGFGRQAFVGMSNEWGTFTLGRQYTMNFWALIDADIIGPSAHGLGAIDSYIPNARADNSIAWRGTFNGLTIGATYSFGRDTVNAGNPSGTNCPGESAVDSKACRGWSGMLKYDAGTWGAAASWDRIRGGAGAFAGLTRSDLTDTRMQLVGYARMGSVKLGGGLLRRNNHGNAATPRSDLWHLGLSWRAYPQLSLDAGLHHIRFDNSSNGADRVVARAVYSLSKRTDLYASASHISNKGALALSVSAGEPGSAPAPGGAQTGTMVGLRHSF